MKKNINKRIGIIIFSISLIAMMIPIVSVASVDTQQYGTGYIESDVEINYLSEDNNSDGLLRAENHALKRDPRNDDWFKNSVSIKNQGSTGLCWTYSATTAAEASYALETKEKVKTLSPGHLAYFAYNRSATLSDPLGGTLGDSTYVSGYTWYGGGGNSPYAFQTMANWTGLATEADAPTDWVYSLPPKKETYSNALAYKDELVLENVEFIQQDSGVDIDTTKSLIEKYGAVCCSIKSPGDSDMSAYRNYYESGTYACYYDGTSGSNHAVTIIGWDDNFSKSKFNSSHQPAQDGAWLIQNSWGSNMKYLWISYYDALVNKKITAYDMDSKGEDEELFQYDGTIIPSNLSVSNGYKLANIYNVTGDNPHGCMLTDVGFTEWNEGTAHYTIRVYTDVKDADDPESGTLAVSKDVTTQHSGYHSWELDTAVELKKGLSYSIEVEVKDSTSSIGIDTSLIGVSGLNCVSSTSYGRCFVKDALDTDWTDTADGLDLSESEHLGPFDIRIKGRATNNLHHVAAKAATTTEEGNIEYYYCSHCNKYYANKYASKELTNGSWIIPKIDASYTLTAQVTGYTGSNAVISLTGPSSYSKTVNGLSYSFTSLAGGQYTLTASADGDYIARECALNILDNTSQDIYLCELGDVNMDGTRSADDITQLARVVAKIKSENDPYALKLYNTDRQNGVEAADITQLARFVAKIITHL